MKAYTHWQGKLKSKTRIRRDFLLMEHRSTGKCSWDRKIGHEHLHRLWTSFPANKPTQVIKYTHTYTNNRNKLAYQYPIGPTTKKLKYYRPFQTLLLYLWGQQKNTSYAMFIARQWNEVIQSKTLHQRVVMITALLIRERLVNKSEKIQER